MVLMHILIASDVSEGHWLTLKDLNLHVKFEDEWDLFIDSLSQASLFLYGGEDILVWEQNVKIGLVSTKIAYEVLVAQRDLPSPRWWYSWM